MTCTNCGEEREKEIDFRFSEEKRKETQPRLDAKKLQRFFDRLRNVL